MLSILSFSLYTVKLLKFVFEVELFLNINLVCFKGVVHDASFLNDVIELLFKDKSFFLLY